MKKSDIIRAWKDADFRNQLGGDVPASPAGDLSTDDLRRVSGGVDSAGADSLDAARRTWKMFSLGCPCRKRRNGTI